MTAAGTDLLFDGPEKAPLTVVLAHGAGAPMNTPFLNSVARGLAAGGYRVARFEFPYMRARRDTGRKGGAPDREPILRNSWKEAVEKLGRGRGWRARPRLPGLSVPSPGPAREAPDEAPRDPRDAGAHRPGDVRRLRDGGGRRGVPALSGDP